MNWTQIIAEIQHHGGLTQVQIARQAQCAQATISDLHKGATKQPNYALGSALMEIHKAVTPSIPTVPETVAHQGV